MATRGVFTARELGFERATGSGADGARAFGGDVALLVIDVQNDFVPPRGALAVDGGDEIVGNCSEAIDAFERVVFSQDYHPEGHSSFASQHEGKSPFEEVDLAYGTQTLWPDHCVQGTYGCEFHADLSFPSRVMVVRKGYNVEVDSYSAFFENDRRSDTGLDEYLKAEKVTRVVVIGLAYDFCVKYTALDARRLGYDVVIIRDCCRGVNMPGTMESAEKELAAAGVRVVESLADVASAL